jgi:hypothetical protein
VDRLLDRLRRGQQATHERVLLDDPRVVAGVAGRRDGRGKRRHRVLAAGGLELAVLRQVLGDGQRVDRVGALVQSADRPEHRPVAVAVEILLLEVGLEQDGLHRRLRDHHRAEHRLLGLDVLRWDVGCCRCLCHRVSDPRVPGVAASVPTLGV